MSKKRGHGEGSIYQDGDKWVASITVGHQFKDGKRRRIRKKFSGQTRREVQEKLTAALRSQQTGHDISPQRQTVQQWLNYWLDEIVANTAKPKTATFYRYIATQHLIPGLGKLQIQKLSPQHVQAFINDRLKAPKQQRGKNADESAVPAELLSARSVRHIHRTLRTALEAALRYGIVQRNAAALVSAPRVAKPKVRFLSVDEARALVAGCADEPMGPLYTVILSLGLRLGEALALSWSDVDFIRGRISIEHTLQRVNGVTMRLETKTENSRRMVDLPAVAVAALRQHQSRQTMMREWNGSAWKGNAWNLMFVSEVGTAVDERRALRVFQEKILPKAGLPKMRLHDLRHSAVALLIASGVNPRAISELLGHSSVGFTLQVYGHLLEDVRRETANRMDSVLAPSIPEPTSVRPS